MFPEAGGCVIPFGDFLEALEGVFGALVLDLEIAEEVFAGLVEGEEGIGDVVAQMSWEVLGGLPDFSCLFDAGLEVQGSLAVDGAGLAGEAGGHGVHEAVVGFEHGFAFGVAEAALLVAGGGGAADHGGVGDVDAAGEEFAQDGAGSFGEGGGAVLDFPDDGVGREAEAFEEPAAELFHVAEAEVFLGAVFARTRWAHAEPEEDGGGEVAGDEEPEVTDLAGDGVDDEEVAFDVVELDLLEE
jgi:hypothetical protein